MINKYLYTLAITSHRYKLSPSKIVRSIIKKMSIIVIQQFEFGFKFLIVNNINCNLIKNIHVK